MKKSLILFVFLLAISSFAFSINVVDSVIVSNHPSLLITEGDEFDLKQTVKSSTRMKLLHDIILKESDKMLTMPNLKYKKIGRRLLFVSRDCLRRLFYLSYSYRMTGNVKYAERAERDMLAVSAFSDWNPTHFLDVAEMTMAVSIGYDWTYDFLSENSRDIISKAIITKGLLPSLDEKFNGWLKGKNNWNQVCNAGMLYGAIAVKDRDAELSNMIIDRSLKSIELPMSEYEPDGTYPEGYGYWNYGTSFNVMFISAAEKHFKKELFSADKMKGFIRSASYITHMVGPSGKVFNYSDGGLKSDPNTILYWFAGKTNDVSLLYEKHMKIDEASFMNDRLLPTAIIWNSKYKFEKSIKPKSNFWTGQGQNPVCLMRTSWTDKNAIYLAFKAGSPSASHGHMDVGSFILEANGERWAEDFGMQEYESLESKGVKLWGMAQNSQRWDIFRYNNLAHNTLAFNDSLQRVSGNCKMEAWSDKPSNMFATSDLTPVYSGQVKKAIRTASILEKSFVSIKDEMETLPEATTLRWTLLTGAKAELMAESNTILLTKNNKTLLIKVNSNAKIQLKTWSAESKNSFDAPNPGKILVGFEAQLPANTKTNFEVLLIPQNK